MNDKERFEKVSHGNIERVQSLETSIMGIGWPLKVILTYVFYSPYLLIVYLVTFIFRKTFLDNRQQRMTHTDERDTAGNNI